MAKKKGETVASGKPQAAKEPKKMGRPKSDNPMNHTISCRVTDGEFREALEYANSHGLTIAEMLHKGLATLIADPSAN